MRKINTVIFFLILLLSVSTYATVKKLTKELTIFSGYVSRLNSEAGLIRIKINFKNSKFLARNNRIELWNKGYPEKKCLAYLSGRTSEYLLVRTSNYDRCVTNTNFTVGTYIQMYSPDLENNLVTAKQLVDILHRKRTALSARKSRYKRDIQTYIEKMDVLNKRYAVLRQKLELEWQKELSGLEEDKLRSFQGFKTTETRLSELEFKLQQYRIQDENLVIDRWSLDPNLYFKK